MRFNWVSADVRTEFTSALEHSTPMNGNDDLPMQRDSLPESLEAKSIRSCRGIRRLSIGIPPHSLRSETPMPLDSIPESDSTLLEQEAKRNALPIDTNVLPFDSSIKTQRDDDILFGTRDGNDNALLPDLITENTLPASKRTGLASIPDILPLGSITDTLRGKKGDKKGAHVTIIPPFLLTHPSIQV
ncbi:hypothetical protein C8R44DRAFT_739136 [Mycena epipterygia]|nr:hypothetical protein C8R44DRAFT_739136 [Mycena epipterygia]